MKKITLLLMVIITSLVFSTSHAGRYDGIVKSLDDFMGNSASIKQADSEKFVAVGENGNKFRIDFEGHDYKPHAHLEVPDLNGNAIDAPNTPHHIYLKD